MVPVNRFPFRRRGPGGSSRQPGVRSRPPEASAFSSTPAPDLGQGTVRLMAVAAGLFVAGIYYNQPMLGILARDLHVGPGGVAAVPVVTQLGYAAGLLLLAPLGDRFERRRLICLTAMALSLSLVLAALAPGIGVLVAASLGVGVLATVAQQVVPMAAQLAPEHRQGQVVGQVMAGLLAGILLARTVSGVVAQYGSWRAMFGLAGVATCGMAVILARRLPRVAPTTVIPYPQLMWSLFRLLRTHRTLRQAGLVQGLLFGSFVAFWAELALFLEQPPFLAGSTVAGLLGLVGVAGVLAAPLAGRLADRGGQRRVITVGAGTVTAAFVLLGVLRTSWTALVAGIVLLDVGLQMAMIANQSRVYALDVQARSRLNTVYMTVMFLCGAAGAALGAQAFALYGWVGVCAMGAACGAVALALELLRSAA